LIVKLIPVHENDRDFFVSAPHPTFPKGGGLKKSLILKVCPLGEIQGGIPNLFKLLSFASNKHAPKWLSFL
jgi:hypothetical protein